MWQGQSKAIAYTHSLPFIPQPLQPHPQRCLRRVINLFFPEYPTRAADDTEFPTMPRRVKNH
ncbi:hypothetical protein [uncultured Nostoc sp.]|uniref:hypothetical protein n=1 Tax=uncultured Nostoc sp. TaxID=340711 RepID=UPI0035CAB40E